MPCPRFDSPQERPIESLPSTDPLPFELRVAVFKAEASGENVEINLVV